MRTIETILYKFEELSEEANNEDYEFTEDGTLNKMAMKEIGSKVIA
jgi:hypothetical protein